MGKENVMSIELPDGAKCVRTEFTKLSMEEAFIWIDFTSIKKSDYKAKRKYARQENLRQNILKAIENNRLEGLYVAILEPSVDDDGNIYFAKGANPGVGYSARWWDDNATKICPERKSRIISSDEYYLIEAHLIKNGDITWEEAAEDSSTKGNFSDSPASTHKMEKTGTSKCGEFYGFVGNTCKYVKGAYRYRYALMGGSYQSWGSSHPVSDEYIIYGPISMYDNSVGWPVLEK